MQIIVSSQDNMDYTLFGLIQVCSFRGRILFDIWLDNNMKTYITKDSNTVMSAIKA